MIWTPEEIIELRGGEGRTLGEGRASAGRVRNAALASSSARPPFLIDNLRAYINIIISGKQTENWHKGHVHDTEVTGTHAELVLAQRL